MAYALLGIPSILFGLELIKCQKRLSGVFLLLNGAACITGIIVYSIKSTALSSLIAVGGVLFLLAVIFMIFEFRLENISVQGASIRGLGPAALNKREAFTSATLCVLCVKIPIIS
jgi:predicted membrane channel-forming protein YqfA (hemolysin III family)